jgi:hypothetical protein
VPIRIDTKDRFMKKILFLIALSCLACFSCQPDKCCDVPGPQNYIKATRNDSDWSIENTVGRLKMDSLIVADTSVNPQRTELLAFKLKFSGTGTYSLTPDNLVYGYVPQMDNPYVYYTLDTSFANSLQVSYYDPAYGLVLGSFSIRVKKDPSNTDNRYPQTVTFLNGAFRVHLSK